MIEGKTVVDRDVTRSGDDPGCAPLESAKSKAGNERHGGLGLDFAKPADRPETGPRDRLFDSSSHEDHPILTPESARVGRAPRNLGVEKQ